MRQEPFQGGGADVAAAADSPPQIEPFGEFGKKVRRKPAEKNLYGMRGWRVAARIVQKFGRHQYPVARFQKYGLFHHTEPEFPEERSGQLPCGMTMHRNLIA